MKKIKKIITNPITIIITIIIILVFMRVPTSIFLVEKFKILFLNSNLTRLSVEHFKADIVILKILYDLLLGSFLIFNIEKMFRNIFGRKARDEYNDVSLYIYTLMSIILIVLFIIMDIVTLTHLIKDMI